MLRIFSSRVMAGAVLSAVLTLGSLSLHQGSAARCGVASTLHRPEVH